LAAFAVCAFLCAPSFAEEPETSPSKEKIIFIVAVLGGGLYYFSKKFAPKFASSRGKNISIIESLSIGPGKQLHLVKVCENQKLLIGTTNNSINILADLSYSVSDQLKDLSTETEQTNDS